LIKTKYVHDLGPTLSATSAFQLLQGVETLDLRLGRHSESAEKVASALADHPRIAKVHHPSLPDSPWHAAALAYLPRGAASVFSVDLVS
ncbi:PLP-dependent transferase, partial [Acinetobacter baumannii]